MRNSDKALLTFGVMAFIFVVLLLWVGFWLPSHIQVFTTYPPANTTYTAENSTSALHLSVQTVPTVLNGVTTATAVIVGFSATIIGISLHEMPKEKIKDRKFRASLIGVFPLSLSSVLLLVFFAYVYLLQGGEHFWLALLLILTGFVVAMLGLIGIFILINYKLEEQETSESEEMGKDLPPKAGNTEENKSTSTKEEIIKKERETIKNTTLEIIELENDPKNATKIKQRVLEIQFSINRMACYSKASNYNLEPFVTFSDIVLSVIERARNPPSKEIEEAIRQELRHPSEETLSRMKIKREQLPRLPESASYSILWSQVVMFLDEYCCYVNSINFDLIDSFWRGRFHSKTTIPLPDINFSLFNVKI